MRKGACRIVGVGLLCLGAVSAQASGGDVYVGQTTAIVAGRLFLGYQISENYSVEAAAIRVVNPIGSIDLPGNYDDLYGAHVSVARWFSLSDRSSVWASMGSFSWKAEKDGDKVDSGTDFTIGLGYQYKLGEGKRWALRAEYQYLGDPGELILGGISYSF